MENELQEHYLGFVKDYVKEKNSLTSTEEDLLRDFAYWLAASEK